LQVEDFEFGAEFVADFCFGDDGRARVVGLAVPWV
jgi:hypothetical protein